MENLEMRVIVHGHIGHWVTAVGLQADRISDRSSGDLVNQLDATLFAVALRNLIRGVEWAREFEPDAVDRALGTFDERVPRAVDARDILEHFDDYDRGRGRLQDPKRTKDRSKLVRNYVRFTVRYESEYLMHLADDIELDVRAGEHAANDLADEVQVALLGRSERPGM